MRTALLGLLLLPFAALAQPAASNECAGAIQLVSAPNYNAVTYNASGATRSTQAAPSCGAVRYDVWFKFTAKSVNPLITLSSVGVNFTTPTIAVYTACGGTQLACGPSPLSAGGTGTELAIGTEYIVRISSQGGTAATAGATGNTFAICIQDIPAGRTGEVFKQTTLVGDNVLNDPWEVAYGPDGYLWVTESKGYKVQRVHPTTGVATEVLNISMGSATSPDVNFNATFNQGSVPGTVPKWPQGGFAGLAVHPDFNHPTYPKPYVYVSYVRSYTNQAPSNGGMFFVNRVVRFTFNSVNNKLESPVSLVDTLPGSSDHNSQRLIIAPVGTDTFLFYASGDMGSGQFENEQRPIKVQDTLSYEGKILRFNLESDGDAGTLDRWIPNDNPYNTPTKQSAVWTIGIRNNQGFAYQKIGSTDILYGISHGPHSDDELNIIKRKKNYGHPLVIGYGADDNYNGSSAGKPGSTCPVITDESTNMTNLGSSYEDPIYSAHVGRRTQVDSIYKGFIGSTAVWPSEAWSGLDIYTSSYIPGWKNSLIAACLKWGRVLKLKLNATGTNVQPINGMDTVSFFAGRNRYRDIAISPDGKDIFVIMDKSATSSGPSANNPVIPSCAGCLQKYTFQGYYSNSVSNKSSIPDWIDVSLTTANTCVPASQVNISNASGNTNVWVPITGPDGNIVAEIFANGNELGNVTTSVYRHSGPVRQNAIAKLYANRDITINVQTQPADVTKPVGIRLYMTASELSTLIAATNSSGQGSGVASISDITILKNTDACTGAQTALLTQITPQYAEAFGSNWVVQGNITSFSTFYLGKANAGTLVSELVKFDGNRKESDVVLNWETSFEQNSAHFDVERSIDGVNFTKVGTVAAAGNSNSSIKYDFTDLGAGVLPYSVLYYRLNMVDLDATSSYSKIVPVKLEGQILVDLFPNPVKTDLNIRIRNQQPAEFDVLVTDNLGRTVHKQVVSSTGATTLSIPAKTWQSGVYLVTVTNSANGVATTQKFEKF